MTTTLNQTDRELLSPWVTSLDGPVYALRGLPEEVVAVLFAYYSRSKEGLRDNLLKLIREGDLELAATGSDPGGAAAGASADFLARAREKARAFHEKWVVGYGHSSVAEHAVVHLAIEEVSILASKVIEDARLASYTEKSTRYVPFDTARLHTPESFRSGVAGEAYRRGIGALASTYDRLMPGLVDWFVDQTPKKPERTEKGHRSACQAQACDVLRYLLPAATQTNLGLTANARVLEGLLSKMLSHPLAEVRELAARMKGEALLIVPTLIKYAEPSDYRASTERAMGMRAAALPARAMPSEPHRLVHLVRHDADAEERVVTAIIAGASTRPIGEVATVVAGLSPAERREILDDYVSRRGRHDPPLRALEATTLTWEIVVDYGAWRDLQRHRMMTAIEQPLTPDLGYERPPAIDAAGMREEFDRAMEAAAAVWRELSPSHPDEAAYVLPLAMRKRVFLTMNLREFHHLVQLRSSRQGHTAYRRVAQAMHCELERALPALAAAVRVDHSDYDLARG